jgi:elongation factor 1-alpha
MSLNHLNLAICGHAKHGKSTLGGRIAYELGGTVSDRALSVLDDEARQKGKDYNKFNLILLKNQPDWFQRGSGAPGDPSRTVVPARAAIDILGTRLTLVDTPGHELFLSNIIYGIYLADLAIVVIDIEEFLGSTDKKISFDTERICRLLRAFDVPILAFCVTKIDIIADQMRKDAFDQAVVRINEDLISKYDFDPATPIIPVSALEGTGVGARGNENVLAPWFTDKSVLDLIREMTPTSQDFAGKAVRFTIEGGREVLSPQGIGTVLVGTLESGKLKVGDPVIAEPASTLEGRTLSSRIRSMHLAKGVTGRSVGPIDEISERAIVSIAVSDWAAKEARSFFSKGGVLGNPSNRPRVARKIRAEVVFFEPDIVYAGKEYRVYPHVSERNGRFLEIISNQAILQLDKEAADMTAGELVQVAMMFDAPCCIETSADFPRLSKFALRQNNHVVGCGRCLEILE